MQIVPHFGGVDAANLLGDKAYLAMSKAERIAFLQNPDNNMRYGTALLGHLVNKHSGDVELALIEYNAGASRVKEFLDAGRDWSKTQNWSKETQPYIQKVLGNLGNARLVARSKPTVSGAVKTAPADRVFLRKFLTSDKEATHVDNMNETLSSRLTAMLKDAPPGVQIYSGYRSVERQRQLFNAAVLKYGSPAAAREWVAPPGKSQHNHGNAADLKFASPETKAWVHANAAKYGLHFRMSHESWHIEPIGDGKGAKPVRVASADGVPGSTRTDAPAPGSPVAATPQEQSGMLSDIVADMPAGDLLKWQDRAANLRRKVDVDDAAMALADEAIRTAGDDPRAAYGLLAQVEDGDVRKAATTAVDAHYTREERMRKDREAAMFEESYAGVYNALQNDDPIAARKAINMGLPPTKQAELQKMITEGPVKADDFRTLNELTRMYYKDPDQFLATDLTAHIGKLTNSTFVQMKGWQDAIRNKLEQGQKVIDPVIEKANPVIERYLGLIGVDTSAKAKEDDIHYENTIRSIVGTEIELLRDRLKREPSILEIEKDVIKPVFKSFRREGWLWGTNEVQLDDVLGDYQSNSLDATEAAAALRRKGMPVNAETLNNLLQKWRQKEGK